MVHFCDRCAKLDHVHIVQFCHLQLELSLQDLRWRRVFFPHITAVPLECSPKVLPSVGEQYCVFQGVCPAPLTQICCFQVQQMMTPYFQC